MTSIHTFDDELARLDAVDTAEAIRKGDLSSTEVVAAAIERARRVEPVANPVACEDYERAMATAGRPAAGPFSGVPTFIKDMTDVAGLPTRNGSDAFATAAPARKTFAIAQQLFDLGMVGLGKSTLPEFGFTPSPEFLSGPPTRNPWNLDRTPGGSSSGAAVLVAAGVVPIAHGQDGGGSLRIPAACNGLVGHKPSRGRLIPDPHARLLPLKIVADGVLTRTVRDTVAYYQAAEQIYQPKHMPKLGKVDSPPERRLRIGAFVESPTGAPIDEATRSTHEDTIVLLEGLGHTVVPCSAPVGDDFADDFIHYWEMLAFFTRYGGKLLFDRSFNSAGLTQMTLGLADGFKSSFRRTPGAIRRLRHSAATYEAQFTDLALDVVLTPTLTHLPPVLGHL
ncbi:MAG TPA: amidase, partial [Microthrixaceae bacterium]|nr:amidase [Microthrixaceae bacterium]